MIKTAISGPTRPASWPMCRPRRSAIATTWTCSDPTAGAGLFKYKAAEINPFAVEVCGDGYDENCDGRMLTGCGDADGDLDSITDCDDNDPKRHHPTSIDPFPDPPNCCGYSLGLL